MNEEVRRFKELGGGDRVIPLIVEGEPGDPTHDCFPPALRFKLGPDGALTEVTVPKGTPLLWDVWTVDDPGEIAALAAAGVDAIITNVPDVALAVLG